MIKKLLSWVSVTTLVTVFVATVSIAHADNTVVVYPNDLESTSKINAYLEGTWFYYDDVADEIDSAIGSFVSGPMTPPEGEASVQISTTGSERPNLATYQFSGTPLKDITELAYSTYNPSAGNGAGLGSDRSGYLHFNIDFNGTDSWQSRLVYVPRDNGTVLQDQWQEWDAINGGSSQWRYSGSVWPGTSDPGMSTLKTWDEILTDYPDARIRVTDSWLGIRVGEPYSSGYTENIDAFKFGTSAGTTTFDFDVDTDAPDVEITAPSDGDTVYGTVDVFGSVVDDNPHHYWLVVQNSSGNTVAGPGTVSEDESFTNANLLSWDTTTLTDGVYKIKLEARDAYNNKDSGSSHWIEVTVSNDTLFDKNQCKNGGWKTFSDPEFKNQGQCVAFVSSGGKNIR